MIPPDGRERQKSGNQKLYTWNGPFDNFLLKIWYQFLSELRPSKKYNLVGGMIMS